MPKSEKEIGEEFRRVVQGKRQHKSRIKMVASEGSGYGQAYVPVLAANNYSLEQGEGSVFACELGGACKADYQEPKKKMSIAGRDYAHEITCLECFVDGGRSPEEMAEEAAAEAKKKAAAEAAAAAKKAADEAAAAAAVKSIESHKRLAGRAAAVRGLLNRPDLNGTRVVARSFAASNGLFEVVPVLGLWPDGSQKPRGCRLECLRWLDDDAVGTADVARLLAPAAARAAAAAVAATAAAAEGGGAASGPLGRLFASAKPQRKPLLGCKLCPMAFHAACAHRLGFGQGCCGGVGGVGITCPHHACVVCGRKSAAAGGMLFRCEACPKAYCEDHLPRAAVIVGGCARLEARGIRMPAQGCYMRCSAKCEAHMAAIEPADASAPSYEPLELDEIGEEQEADAGAEPDESEAAAVAAGSAALAAAAGPSTAGSSGVEKLFTSILAARAAVGASDTAAFRADVQELLQAIATEEDDDGASDSEATEAGAAARFVSCGAGYKPGWFLKELTRRAKQRRTTPDQVTQMMSAALADGYLLELPAEPNSSRLFASGAALTATIRTALATEAAAHEALAGSLTERVAADVVRLARSQCGPRAGLPPFTIPLFRALPKNFCPLGFDCSSVARRGPNTTHLCYLFRTEEERELVPTVIERLVADGTLSVVGRDGEITPGGKDVNLDLSRSTYMSKSRGLEQPRGFTVARTEEVLAAIREMEAEEASRAKRALELEEQREAKRARAEEAAAKERVEAAAMLAEEGELIAALSEGLPPGWVARRQTSNWPPRTGGGRTQVAPGSLPAGSCIACREGHRSPRGTGPHTCSTVWHRTNIDPGSGPRGAIYYYRKVAGVLQPTSKEHGPPQLERPSNAKEPPAAAAARATEGHRWVRAAPEAQPPTLGASASSSSISFGGPP